MALIKLNDRAVKDATTFGSISSLGEMKFISKATASSSASIEFTSGIDSTYKEYVFYFVNMHPSAQSDFTFQASTDSGSTYATTCTSIFFKTYHLEAGGGETLAYDTERDQAQSTGFVKLNYAIGSVDSDLNCVGYLHLFNPSSTTYVKHFISNNQGNLSNTYSANFYVGGYFNTTSAIDAVKFQMSSGNIDAGEILLFGIN